MTQDIDQKAAASGGLIDPTLLDVLVCPITRGPLDYDRVREELVSHQLGKAFPVRDGVPVMLLEEARDLSEDEIRKHKP